MYKKNNEIISSNIYETTISGFKNINLDKILENKYNMDILEEIIINSRICFSKYIFF